MAKLVIYGNDERMGEAIDGEAEGGMNAAGELEK